MSLLGWYKLQSFELCTARVWWQTHHLRSPFKLFCPHLVPFPAPRYQPGEPWKTIYCLGHLAWASTWGGTASMALLCLVKTNTHGVATEFGLSVGFSPCMGQCGPLGSVSNFLGNLSITGQMSPPSLSCFCHTLACWWLCPCHVTRFLDQAVPESPLTPQSSMFFPGSPWKLGLSFPHDVPN